ncbi:MAG: STAS domain-containing protein [Gammaproteobacteria bacterium]
MKQRKGARKTGSSKRTAAASASSRKPVHASQKASRTSPKPSRALVLPGECGVASAAKLRDALLKRLNDGASVKLDASAVQRVDSAALQVLAAFARDRRTAGRAIEWIGVTETLAEAVGLLSLTEVLGFSTRPDPVAPT